MPAAHGFSDETGSNDTLNSVSPFSSCSWALLSKIVFYDNHHCGSWFCLSHIMVMIFNFYRTAIWLVSLIVQLAAGQDVPDSPVQAVPGWTDIPVLRP